jgi:microcystin-dependent protein
MATYVTGRMVQDETIDTRDLQQGVAIPPGAVMSFAMSAAPVGWLPCDGSAINRTTYSALFNVVRTIHGVGDGSNTFNVPDLRGEFIRGWAAGRDVGGQSTRVFGSTEEDEFKSHNHSITDPGHVHTGGLMLFGYTQNASGAPNFVSNQNTGSATTGITINNSGGVETRPRNIALLYCIKF